MPFVGIDAFPPQGLAFVAPEGGTFSFGSGGPAGGLGPIGGFGGVTSPGIPGGGGGQGGPLFIESRNDFAQLARDIEAFVNPPAQTRIAPQDPGRLEALPGQQDEITGEDVFAASQRTVPAIRDLLCALGITCRDPRVQNPVHTNVFCGFEGTVGAVGPRAMAEINARVRRCAETVRQVGGREARAPVADAPSATAPAVPRECFPPFFLQQPCGCHCQCGKAQSLCGCGCDC